MDGWKDGTIVPTFQRSIGPPDPLAHSPGRHPPGAAGGGPAPDLRPRLLDRPRDRRPVRRRAEAPDVRDAREPGAPARSEEHTSELQSRLHLVCRLLLEKK